MILHDITPLRALRPHTCGHAPHLVEARGRCSIDARLFGKPSRQYHVECAHCGVGTTPVYSQRSAESLWSLSFSVAMPDCGLVAIADIPALRLKAEQLLARALIAA